mmetsp:Transcript_31166/g.93445  ORF Transcript_31166/g.93445 Transcript_31166/m.93445 type:complete len:136 (+) Transcript_31166:188-595(+)
MLLCQNRLVFQSICLSRLYPNRLRQSVPSPLGARSIFAQRIPLLSDISLSKSNAPGLPPCEREGKLILVRHGQSAWNVTDPSRGLTARFTGWADVGLTQRGREQALAAGQALGTYFDEHGKRCGHVDCVFTSLLC